MNNLYILTAVEWEPRDVASVAMFMENFAFCHVGVFVLYTIIIFRYR